MSTPASAAMSTVLGALLLAANAFGQDAAVQELLDRIA